MKRRLVILLYKALVIKNLGTLKNLKKTGTNKELISIPLYKKM